MGACLLLVLMKDIETRKRRNLHTKSPTTDAYETLNRSGEGK